MEVPSDSTTSRRRSYDKTDNGGEGGLLQSDSRKSSSSGGGSGNWNNKYEDPPNSRLFIVCSKQITEEDFREAFRYFGTIEEIWMVRDKASGEPKGVTYIKFAKTSEAAFAMEEMNGRCIANSPRPLKVLIAHSREQGSRRETNEEERLLRLFVVVPKTMTETELKTHFSNFGDIDYVSLVKDRGTKESKGFGYVKYHRMSHAAKAFEECDRSFKPVFAEPRPQKPSSSSSSSSTVCSSTYNHGNDDHHHHHRSHRANGCSSSSGYDVLNYMDTSQSNPEGLCRLSVLTSPSVNQDQLWRLFDLIPGLDYCDQRRPRSGQFTAVYNNPQSATYAKEKLHGFEYPPGHRMVVKFEGNGGNSIGKSFNFLPPGNRSRNGNIQNDLAHLTETIANATALLQAAGYSPNAPTGGSSETYDPSYCSVKLPPPQPLAAIDSVVEERLFIVCSPTPPHLYALKDVFGRFGSLIDIYMLSGKTCGYAKYASKASANSAVSALHGQEICGSRLKVMQADPQQDKSESSNGRKRAKIASDSVND